MSKIPIHAKVRFVPVVLAFLTAALMCQAQFQIVVPYNKTWKFEQSNIDLGTTWKDPGFDDSGPGWGTGIGPLGFNNLSTNEALLDGLTIFTLINRTTNGVQPRTYYFRTTFEFTNSPSGVSLVFSNLIDDAAVFWLNGVEVGRVAFNTATVVTFSTPGDRAASDVSSYGYDNFTNLSPGLVQGTNTLAIEVHQTGNNSSDLVLATRIMAVIPTPLVITQQPTNITSVENRVINLAVGVTGTAPQFQWYKGTNPAVAITDATNATYTIANSVIADTGDYFVIATNFLNAVTSLVARLTVSNDTNGPVLVSVKTDETFQKVTLNWDETISEGPAIEISNYYMLDALDNEVLISGVQWLGNKVVLTVPTMQAGATYRVEADFQFDLVGNLTSSQGTLINPNGDPDHFVESPFQTFVISPAFTKFQAYLNLPAGQSIAQFTAMPIYPDGQTFGFYTNVLYWPQSLPGNGYEQYAMRFSGLFVAPETGLYKFDPDHDDDVRLRFSDSELPSGTITELSAACCTGLLDGPTLDVSLVAGQRYYYELIVREFGGGDHAGVSVILPSGPTNSPISQEYLAIAFDPANTVNAGISQQPQTTTILDNHTATFSVTVTNATNGVTYQWQLDSGGGFNSIAGAYGSSHTTPLRTLANEGNLYRVIAYTPGLILTSAVAVLHVNNDNVPPQVLSVRGQPSLSAIRVTFNEVLASGSATTVGNYTLTTTNGTPVNLSAPVLSGDLTTVTIQTDPQPPGTYYILHVQNVTDAAGNPVGPTNITFQAWVLSRGFALFEAYDTGGGNDVVMLTSHPSYPNNPRDVAFIPTFDSRNAYPNDSHEAYGARLSGFFTANATTNFVFYFSADDASEFWMSPDNNRANRVLLRSATTCCTANSVNPVTNALVAGQTYYMDLLYKEGTGGDYGRVVVKHIGDPTNPDILTPIGGGQFLSTLADPVGAFVSITQQPTNQTRLPGQTAAFSVQATGLISTWVSPVAYQWQKFVSGVFVDIPGANAALYTTPTLLVGDNGSQYRALVFIPGNSAVSSVATVTVVPPAPTLRSSFSGGILSFSWDAPARLQCTFSLTPPVVWQDVTGSGITNYTVDPANEFNVVLDTAQEANPIGGRTGTGLARVTLSNNVLKVSGTYTGLSANRNNIHFHAPAVRNPAITAGVAYNLAGITTGTTSGTILGDVTMANAAYLGKTIAAQIQDLRSGLWYMNIHSTAFPGGEIRGQVESGAQFYRLINP